MRVRCALPSAWRSAMRAWRGCTSYSLRSACARRVVTRQQRRMCLRGGALCRALRLALTRGARRRMATTLPFGAHTAVSSMSRTRWWPSAAAPTPDSKSGLQFRRRRPRRRDRCSARSATRAARAACAVQRPSSASVRPERAVVRRSRPLGPLCDRPRVASAVAAGATLPRTHAFKFDDGLLEERITLHAPSAELPPPAAGCGVGTEAPRQGAGGPAAPPRGAVLSAQCSLEYVYDQFRVVHRGALRATFSATLKARSTFWPRSHMCCFCRAIRSPPGLTRRARDLQRTAGRRAGAVPSRTRAGAFPAAGTFLYRRTWFNPHHARRVLSAALSPDRACAACGRVGGAVARSGGALAPCAACSPGGAAWCVLTPLTSFPRADAGAGRRRR